MDRQYGGTLRHFIVGTAVAFIFGSAYILEMRYSDLHSEIKIREAELASMKQKTKDLESKVEMFERILEGLSEEKETGNLTKRMSIIESRIDGLEKEVVIKPVVFYAVTSSTSYLQSKELNLIRKAPVNVVYDTVIYQVGNAYNPRNGFFTAPSGGLYVFTWTTLVAAQKLFNSELLINGQRVGLGNCNNEGNPGFENCANIIPVPLKFGDEVNIRAATPTFIYGDHWSSFKGWKVW